MSKPTNMKAYALDIAERTAAAAIEGFLAVAVAAGAGIFHASALEAAAAAGLNAGFAVLKGLIAGTIGSHDSASLVPTIGTAATSTADTAVTAATPVVGAGASDIGSAAGDGQTVAEQAVGGIVTDVGNVTLKETP